ncbi:M48 family metallopeptidase [Candidatus Margulisiibacteriota bacterium]
MKHSNMFREGETMQPFQLIRSRRRSLALIVTQDAKLVIRAPHRLPEIDIHKFVRAKRRWIARKMAQAASRPRLPVLTPAQEQDSRELAKKIIPQRVKYYSEMTGLKPACVRISSARKRWGSCGAKGTLNFAWRLVLAPPPVIDYVVVHELVHLVERDHSRRFWSRVGEVMPDYKVQRRWLRSN